MGCVLSVVRSIFCTLLHESAGMQTSSGPTARGFGGKGLLLTLGLGKC